MSSAAPAGQAVAAQQQVTQIQQLQTAQGGHQPQAPAKLVLGQLPGGKLVLQGSQLAALTQARGAGQSGGQPKVLTIQLQVQQQPNQQGGIKVRKKFNLSVNQIVFVLQYISYCFYYNKKFLWTPVFSFVKNVLPPTWSINQQQKKD